MILSEEIRNAAIEEYYSVRRNVYHDWANKVALLEDVVEAANELADAVNRSPVYHKVKDTYTSLRDALAKLENNK